MKKIEENKKINIRLIDFKFASYIVVRKPSAVWIL